MTTPIPKVVQFFPDGSVSIEFTFLPRDVKRNGMFLTRSIYVPAGGPDPRLADIGEDLHEDVIRALKVALARFEHAATAEPQEPDDDDTPAPYDNPQER